MESEPGLYSFVLTRFLPQISLRNLRKLDCYANRFPLRSKTLWDRRPNYTAGSAGRAVPRSFIDRLIKNIAVGRRMNRSATSAAIIKNALSQPNRRSEGRSENTV